MSVGIFSIDFAEGQNITQVLGLQELYIKHWYKTETLSYFGTISHTNT